MIWYTLRIVHCLISIIKSIHFHLFDPHFALKYILNATLTPYRLAKIATKKTNPLNFWSEPELPAVTIEAEIAVPVVEEIITGTELWPPLPLIATVSVDCFRLVCWSVG